MLDKDVFMNTYTRLPIVFTRGQGAYLFDGAGERYLDFTAGIAVNCLGHNYPPLVKAITEQTAKLNHVGNYYQSDVSVAFAEALTRAAGMEKVFFGNSGAEANEGACKVARKYSLQKYGAGRHTIVTLKGSFHGRTITMLSATGQEHFHKDFGPFTEGFRYVPCGDIDALDKALDHTVAGLFIEAVQGESGVVPQTREFVEAAARLCAERDILLMFDEIQCGLGRTGSFLAASAYGVKPDVVTLAKGLAGGVPVGAVLVGEKAADVFAPGDHGSTFGGNPLAAAAGLVVLEAVNNGAFLKEIGRKGERMMATIRSWNSPVIKEVRGRGLMIGVDITASAWDILLACLKKGLLILSTGKNTLRFLPPYIITDEEIDAGLATLRECLK
ncbi:MAG: aspartate aminotransferase family protein [Treponema sp.]|jgi:acetylornithine/N-succinyldiaminopimelate aminotransferase|nr:aspartate aminotransferase family protein [Treponema sp.]